MIIKQGEPLPAFNSMSEEERTCLHQRVGSIISHSGLVLSAEVIPVRSIGSQGDQRSYDLTVVLSPMQGECTAQQAGLLATQIINEANGIGRVLFDITPGKNEGGSG